MKKNKIKELADQLQEQKEKLRKEVGVSKRALGKGLKRLYPVNAFGKTGRNEPCPCGSGIKYKRCHGNKY